MYTTKLHYNIRWGLALLLALGVWLLMQPMTARAETITVTNTLDDGAGSLRAAIAAANPGDTVVFSDTLAGETITLTSQLAINKALTLDGSALTEPIKISGNDSVRVFYVTADATLTHLDIISGTAIHGGGVYNTAALTLTHCTVRNNTASNSHGGGLYNYGGTVTIRESVIRDNQTTGSTVGGGLVNWGTMTVVSSTIAGNAATAGGGVRNEGTLTIHASTISSNTAAYAGGIANLGTLALANCTLSGNTATHGTYAGSALYQWGDSSYTTAIHHCTIANNTAAGTHQAAVELENGVMTLKNSLIADNGGNFYRWGNANTYFTSQGYNLADTWDGVVTLTTGDQTADPLLDALADNGPSTGSGHATLTHALLPGSPALDAANPTVSLTTDQRGIARPQDFDFDGSAVSDIGAFEAQSRITLTKSATPALDAPYHGVVTYTVVLDNAMNADDTLILTDTLPAQTDFARWVENPGAGVTGNQITWSGVLTAHTALTFTFQVTQTGDYGATIINTAEARNAMGPMSAAASFTVIGPKTALHKTASPATAPYHGILTYTLVLSNPSVIADPTVHLTDTLPAEVDFARWVENHGALVNSDQITWTGSLAADTALTFTFQVTHTGEYNDTIVNTAEFSGSTRAGQATATVSTGCAPTYTVQLTSNDGAGSLRYALANVCAGGGVNFAPALAGQTISLAAPLDVATDVVIDGSGLSSPVRISGNDATRLFVIASGVHATLTGIDLVHGYATDGGAAISNAGYLMLTHAQVTDHHGTSAIYNTNQVTLIYVTVARSGGNGFYGGGLRNLSSATVLSSTLADNTADSGGAIYNQSSLTLRDSVISGNTVHDPGGGGVHIDGGSAMISRCDFHDNATSRLGGGLLLQNGSATVSESVIRNNTAIVGGGLSSTGLLTVLSSTVSGNTASLYYGGGAYNEAPGTLIVRGSTFSGNTARYGGAIANKSIVRLDNSTLSGNVSTDGAWGSSALDLWYANNTEINHCTIVSNTANTSSDQSGILLEAGTLILRNSIVAHNNGTYNFRQTGGTFTSQGYNLTNAWNGMPTTTGDLTGDPLLGPRADNGGGTLTHALLPGSPALDAANPTVSLTTDQRGIARPQDFDHDGYAISDIGAFEALPPEIFLTKSAEPAVAAPYHGVVTYTLILNNSGADTDPTVFLTDTLPTQVTFARWVENHGALASSNQITWTGSLTAHTALTFTFQVTHTGDYGETVINTGKFSGVLGVGQAAASFTVERPQLALRKTVTPVIDVTYHGVVTYTLVLSNTGPVADPAARLTDTLPAQVDFARWVGDSHGALISSDQITWTGSLAAQTALTFTFQATHTGDYGDVVLNAADFSGLLDAGQATASFSVACGPALTVTNTANDGPGSLRQALANVCAGGVVNFASALAGETITLTEVITIGKPLTLDGGGLSARVRINGDDATRLFIIGETGAVTMTQLVLTKGCGIYDAECINYGGAICNAGALTLQDMHFTDNQARFGGAVYSYPHSRLWVNASEFYSNIAWADGGALYVHYGNTRAQVTGSIFMTNTAADNGGAMVNQGGVLTVTDSLISGNSSTQNGGGLYLYDGPTTLTGTTIAHNQSRYGGGVYNFGRPVAITGTYLLTNTATFGGALYSDEAHLSMTQTLVAGNTAADLGGGLYLVRGVAVISDSTLRANRTHPSNGRRGGAIFNGYGNQLTLTRSAFTGNQAKTDGGGIYNTYAPLTVQTSDFISNTANAGGALYSEGGTLNVSQSAVYSNTATIKGGGLYIYGTTATVDASTFAGNRITHTEYVNGYGGGGLYNHQGTLTVQNSTLANNAAAVNSGGGLYNTGDATVRASTLSGNAADYGGGLWNEQGYLHLQQTIVAHSSAGHDCGTIGGTVDSVDGIFEATQENACGVSGDYNTVFGVDPLLGPLADNGGETPTFALLPNSPAIDAVKLGVCLPTDQRGAARDDWACDIGAFEARLSDTPSVSKTVTGAGIYTFGPTLAKVEVSDAGGCLTGLQVERVESNHPNATTPLLTGAYWTITPTGCTSGFTATLTLPFDEADATSRLCRWLEGTGPGYGWDCDDAVASHTTFVANSWVIRSHVTGFSEWVVGNDVGPTAVRLKALTARGGVWGFSALSVLAGGLVWARRKKSKLNVQTRGEVR